MAAIPTAPWSVGTRAGTIAPKGYPMQNTEQIWTLVDAKRDAFEALSDRVFDAPEIAYTEYKAVAEHTAMLEREGFRITAGLAGIPTAVMGEAGAGGPGDRHPRGI